ncbi:hypothetical protein BKA93DRAFT_826947 [Sparassis latifolia]
MASIATITSSFRCELTSMPASKCTDCVQHRVFWLRDGSVGIHAEKTLFKLHGLRLDEEPRLFEALFKASCMGRDTTDAAIRGPERGHFATHLLPAAWCPDLAHLTPKRMPHAAEAILLARNSAVSRIPKRAYHGLLRSPGFWQNNNAGKNTNGDLNAPALSMVDYASLLCAKSGRRSGFRSYRHLHMHGAACWISPACPLVVRAVAQGMLDPIAEKGNVEG